MGQDAEDYSATAQAIRFRNRFASIGRPTLTLGAWKLYQEKLFQIDAVKHRNYFTGKNVWKPQARRWSTSAIGVDDQDKVLFIHVRALYSTYDLINILKKLPLNISRAMYTEGGPQAQLYLITGDQELELTGSYETGSNNANEGSISWPLPNVLGILKR